MPIWQNGAIFVQIITMFAIRHGKISTHIFMAMTNVMLAFNWKPLC
jgi:hypothetical protein